MNQIVKLFLGCFLIIGFSFNSNAQYTFTTSVEGTNEVELTVTVNTSGLSVEHNDGGCVLRIKYDYSYAFHDANGNEMKLGSVPLYTLQGSFVCSNPDNSSFFPILYANEKEGSFYLTERFSVSGTDRCKNISMEDFSCNIVRFQINFPGFDNSVEVEGTMIDGALPIELLSFDVEKKDNNVEVLWQTASETNNDFFTIERSKDGITWENVQTVLGAGNSARTISYAWTDHAPHSGVSYYRLTQTDFDGKSETFDIVSVERGDLDLLSVYPNPASDIVTIFGADEKQAIQVFNTIGIDVTKNLVFSGKQLDISKLPRGIYYIKNGTKNTSVVKQ